MSKGGGPLTGRAARVKVSGRIGEVVVHDPNDAQLAYKLKFNDGGFPAADWFSKDAVEVCLSMNEMVVRAAGMRRMAMTRLAELKREVAEDFAEYKKRLQAMVGAKSATAAGKVILGLIPGGHAVAEATQAASVLNEIQKLLTDCSNLGALAGDIMDGYTATVTDLASQEEKLINLLARPVRVAGEALVIKEKKFEPAHRIIKNLLEIKALSERLRVLDDLRLFSGSSADVVRSKL